MPIPQSDKVYVATANALRTGDVVFFAGEGRWNVALEDAQLAVTPAEVATLEVLVASAEAEVLTAAAYVIEVERGPGGALVPVRRRERLRISGPSIRQNFNRRKSSSKPASAAAASMGRENARRGQTHVSL